MRWRGGVSKPFGAAVSADGGDEGLGRGQLGRGQLGSGQLGRGELGSEEGSATVALLGVIGAVLLIFTVGLAASSIQTKRAWLQAVSDAAALQAADAGPVSMVASGQVTSFSTIGCEAAAKVALANGATVQECRSVPETPGDFVVTLAAGHPVAGWQFVVTATSRAGPALPLPTTP